MGAFTTNEVSTRLGISPSRVYALIKRGTLTPTRQGHAYLFSATEIDPLLEERRVAGERSMTCGRCQRTVEFNVPVVAWTTADGRLGFEEDVYTGNPDCDPGYEPPAPPEIEGWITLWHDAHIIGFGGLYTLWAESVCPGCLTVAEAEGIARSRETV